MTDQKKLPKIILNYIPEWKRRTGRTTLRGEKETNI
jgi:hypothetical protein